MRHSSRLYRPPVTNTRSSPGTPSVCARILAEIRDKTITGLGVNPPAQLLPLLPGTVPSPTTLTADTDTSPRWEVLEGISSLSIDLIKIRETPHIQNVYVAIGTG